MFTASSTTQTSKSNHYSEHQSPLELIQKLAHWEAIFESSHDSIITKDLNGIITSWNPASEKIYGYNKDEVIGKSITILFPPELKNEFPRIMNKLKKGERIENHDTLRVRKDGKIIHVSVSLSPIRDLEGKIVGGSGIGHDISDRIELERRKDDFISIASHEFKTPLTSLKGFTQILMQKPQNLEPTHLIYLEKMCGQIEKLNQLVTDLLAVAQIQNGKMQLNKKQFKIDDLVKEVVEDMKQQISHHQMIVEIPKSPDPILADRYRINQVLVNLISNAVKYSPKADKIIVKATKHKNRIIISVQDFGIGVFKKNQTQIFDRFFQAKNKIRESSSGLGLGLFICSEIVRGHKGRIWVKSTKGEGSTFSFSLPMK